LALKLLGTLAIAILWLAGAGWLQLPSFGWEVGIPLVGIPVVVVPLLGGYFALSLSRPVKRSRHRVLPRPPRETAETSKDRNAVT
jgi:hypothetical protein